MYFLKPFLPIADFFSICMMHCDQIFVHARLEKMPVSV